MPGQRNTDTLPAPIRFRHSAGFTLMEILLALTILAIIVVSLGGVSSRQLRAASEADQLLQAELLAENELNRLLAGSQVPALGSSERQIQYAGGEFDVSVTAASTDAALLRRLEVVVREVGGRELVTLVGFRGSH